MTVVLFEYMYRDADNYKAAGEIALCGDAADEELDAVRAALSATDDLFVAEQIRVPPLYTQLHQWSGGPTAADHCWHTFLRIDRLSDRDLSQDVAQWGSTRDFIDAVRAVTEWREELSQHFRTRLHWRFPMEKLRRFRSPRVTYRRDW